MIIIKYCMAPSGRYVAWFEYENAHYYGSGNTIKLAFKNVKQNYWKFHRHNPSGCKLDSKKSETCDAPLVYMSNMFKKKNWCANKEKSKSLEFIVPNIEKQELLNDLNPIPSTNHKIKEKEEKSYDFYTYKRMDGKLIVYGCKKVQVYELQKED